MVWPADYHMHTPLCRHATGEPAEYAARAVALGLKEIGFSDHSPMRQDDFDDWRMRADQLDLYVEQVNRVRRDHPSLTILLALEIDYLPGQEDWIRELAARHPWDYLIGSVHYISNSWAIDNPHQIADWKRHDPAEVWGLYIERLTMAANSGLFDILGHVDLCKKFGFRPPGDLSSLFTPCLEAASGRGVAIELNTAGLRKECREVYPSAAILQNAWKSRVAITFGSDAHAPEEVGYGFDQALRLATEAGYTHWRRFSGQTRRDEPL